MSGLQDAYNLLCKTDTLTHELMNFVIIALPEDPLMFYGIIITTPAQA